jgi:hypothetical protein
MGSPAVDSVSPLRQGSWLGSDHSRAFGTFRAAIQYDPTGAWRGSSPLAAWCELYPLGANLGDTHDVYQFGVYTGGSMAGLTRFLDKLEVHFGTLWGFDSFEGLPDPKLQELSELKRISDWRAGGFSAADALGMHDFGALVTNLTATIGRRGGPVNFVRGYFNESLTPSLAQQRGMRPALYVDVVRVMW